MNFASKPSTDSIPKIFSLSFSSRVLLLFIASLLFAAGFYLYFFSTAVFTIYLTLNDISMIFNIWKNYSIAAENWAWKKSNFHLTNCFISSSLSLSDEWRENTRDKKMSRFRMQRSANTHFAYHFLTATTHSISYICRDMECVHLRERGKIFM